MSGSRLERARGRPPRLRVPLLALLVASAGLCLRTDTSHARLGDHAADLEQVEHDLQSLAANPLLPSAPGELAARSLALLQRRAVLSGSLDDETRAQSATREALRRLGPLPDLLLLDAQFALHVHRVAAARDDLERLPREAHGSNVEALWADVALQMGDYTAARGHCQRALATARDWDVLARLAQLEALTGTVDAADALYAQAEDELTAKQMRAYAWLELQRGLLALSRGRHADAERHYGSAERAYSGDWRAAAQRAELLAAARRYDDALALYAHVVARTPRPELLQALGDLLAFVGRKTDARPWHERALGGYLASVERGEVQYYHHLTGFYADVRSDGVEALRWARRDAALRGGATTHAALAWALYRAGRLDEARASMRTALESGVQDAHLYLQAATLSLASGDAVEGRLWRARAAALNPYYEAFHVHR